MPAAFEEPNATGFPDGVIVMPFRVVTFVTELVPKSNPPVMALVPSRKRYVVSVPNVSNLVLSVELIKPLAPDVANEAGIALIVVTLVKAFVPMFSPPVIARVPSRNK